MKTSKSDPKKAILDGLIELFGQNRWWLLFIGTGTSVALDQRLGMPALAEHLRQKTPQDADGWAEVQTRLAEGQGLEQALTGARLSQATKRQIERWTGNHIAECDASLRNEILLGRKNWPGERLLRCLVQRLPPSNPRLPVVTPNYDMLIEYACAWKGIRYTTGYAGEVIRRWNWKQTQDSLTRNQDANQRGRKVVGSNLIPRVELLKLHGSINLFREPESRQLVECDVWATNPPDGYTREIAAPGEQKYESFAHNADPAAVAREAEDRAQAFLMIGYGFSDLHLHERILGRLSRNDCPLVVLTLDLPDDRVAMLRRSGTRVWIMTADKSETSGGTASRTRVYCPLFDEPVLIEDESLWSCEAFADRILGA